MQYEKQEFVNGQVLTAECLNRMESGIKGACDAVPPSCTSTDCSKVLSHGENGCEWVDRATDEHIAELLNSGEFGIGRAGSGAGSEVFNDYEKNRAISELASVSGSENIAGLTGYFFYSVDFENKVMVLTKVFDVAPAEPFVTGYEVGDVLTIIASDHFYDCSVITAIDNNTITVDSLPFSTITSSGTGRKSVFCFEKPDVGAVTHFGKCATAEGYQNESFGLYGHAEGYKNKTLGYYGHTEGRENVAYFSAHAEGIRNKAIARYAHAEGESTTASGRGAHTEGQKTEATSWYAHAEGNGSKATGFASHAEGENTTASGRCSHAEGCNTQAIGDYSHAAGTDSLASGDRSRAEGYGLKAIGECQNVQGRWNEESANYAHIIGNGADANHRSNAHTVDWNGNAWYAGTVEATAIILKSPNGTRFSIGVNNDGTLFAITL